MAHALLSPSGASRWLVCTPSPRLEQDYPDSSSDFAEEGTLAHSYAEAYTRFHDDPKNLKKELTRLSKTVLHKKYYSPELEEHAQEFADYVLEKCVGDYNLEVEQKLDFTEWVTNPEEENPERQFGTGDAIVVKDGVLDLIDLKYGRGVKVSAVENKQLMIYALGCVSAYGWIYEFDTIRLNIYQPRLGNISVWSIPVADLLQWAETDLKPKALLAYKGEGVQVAGEHCRFCKVKAECKALSEFALELAKEEFAEPALLTPEQIGETLPKIEVAEMYIKAIKEHAYSKLLSGEKIPGFKLVKGRSTRAYTDPETIRTTLEKAGFSGEEILTKPVAPSLLGLTALEKAIKKQNFEKYVSPFVKRNEGKPSLAPETDKREEFSSIDADFADDALDSWM